MVIILEGKTEKDKQFLQQVTWRIRKISFEDKEGLSLFSMELEHADLSLFGSDKVLLDGKEIYAQWGEGDNVTKKRKIILTKITGFSILTISGVSSLFTSDLEPKQRLWEGMKYTDIVKVVASEMGYENPDIEDLPSDWQLEDVQQYETNARFLQRLATRVGYAFWVGPDNLHWRSRSVKGKPSLYLRWKGTVLENRKWGDIKGEPEVKVEFSRSKPKVVVVKAKKDRSKMCKDFGELSTEEQRKLANEQETTENKDIDSAAYTKIKTINDSDASDSEKKEQILDVEAGVSVAKLKTGNKKFRIMVDIGKRPDDRMIKKTKEEPATEEDIAKAKAAIGDSWITGSTGTSPTPTTTKTYKITSERSTGNISISSDNRDKKQHTFAEGGKLDGVHKAVKHGPSGKSNRGYGKWVSGLVELKITIYGLAKVYIGQICNLDGVGVFLNGKYYIRGVYHTVDKEGFTQILTITRDSGKKRPPGGNRKVNKCVYTIADPKDATTKTTVTWKITQKDDSSSVKTGNIAFLRKKTVDGVAYSNKVGTVSEAKGLDK